MRVCARVFVVVVGRHDGTVRPNCTRTSKLGCNSSILSQQKEQFQIKLEWRARCTPRANCVIRFTLQLSRCSSFLRLSKFKFLFQNTKTEHSQCVFIETRKLINKYLPTFSLQYYLLFICISLFPRIVQEEELFDFGAKDFDYI